VLFHYVCGDVEVQERGQDALACCSFALSGLFLLECLLRERERAELNCGCMCVFVVACGVKRCGFFFLSQVCCDGFQATSSSPNIPWYIVSHAFMRLVKVQQTTKGSFSDGHVIFIGGRNRDALADIFLTNQGQLHISISFLLQILGRKLLLGVDILGGGLGGGQETVHFKGSIGCKGGSTGDQEEGNQCQETSHLHIRK